MITGEEMDITVQKFLEDLWTAMRRFHNYKNDCPNWVMWVELTEYQRGMFMKWVLDRDLIGGVYEIGHDITRTILENKTN